MLSWVFLDIDKKVDNIMATQVAFRSRSNHLKEQLTVPPEYRVHELTLSRGHTDSGKSRRIVNVDSCHMLDISGPQLHRKSTAFSFLHAELSLQSANSNRMPVVPER